MSFHQSQKHPQEHLPYLDGLRTLAVLAVLLYHHDNSWLPGGFLGVECFFVISGFIITRLLLDEWLRSGRIDLAAFYLRRLRRLVPGILAMVLTAWTAVHLFFPDAAAQLRQDLPYSLSFTLNLHYILTERSYFQNLERPPVLEHLWSLGVEFQFYLLWPALCLLLFRLKPRLAELVLGLGVLIAAWWMAHLHLPEADPSRIYFGADTRVGAFLLGAGIASAMARSRNMRWHRSYSQLVSGLGIAAFLGLLALLLQLNSTHERLYQGGFLLVSLCAAALIASCHLMLRRGRRNFITALLSNPFSRGLGLRAYSLYLWHWPVYCLTQPGVDIALANRWLFAFRIALTLSLSEISYQYVETVFRRKPQVQPEAAGSLARWQLVRTAGTAAGCLLTAAVILQLHPGPTVVMPTEPLAETEEALPTTLPTLEDDRPAAEETNAAAVAVDEREEKTEPPQIEAAAATTKKMVAAFVPADFADHLFLPGILQESCACNPLAQTVCIPNYGLLSSCGWTVPKKAGRGAIARAHQARRQRSVGQMLLTTKDRNGFITHAYTPGRSRPVVTAVGDSVMIRAAPELLERIPGLALDAQVGRQFAAGQKLLKNLSGSKQLGDVVLIHLGNNGPLAAKQIEILVQSLRDVKVIVMVNLKLPRNYETANNNLLIDITRKYPQVKLIDWRTVSMREGNIFVKDGMHLNQRGARLYAEVIVDSLSEIGALKAVMN